MLSTLVVAGVLSVFTGLYTSSAAAMKRSRWRTVAARACYGELERKRAGQFSQLNALIPSGQAEVLQEFTPPSELPVSRGRLQLRRVRFNGVTMTTWTPGSSRPDGIEITATAYWKSAARTYGEESVSVSGVIVNRPQRLLERLLEILP